MFKVEYTKYVRNFQYISKEVTTKEGLYALLEQLSTLSNVVDVIVLDENNNLVKIAELGGTTPVNPLDYEDMTDLYIVGENV